MNRIHLRLIALVSFFLALPWFLSRRPRVVRRAVMRGNPADIFPLLNDLRNWPLWTDWARCEEMRFSYDGAPAGVGATQRWSSRKMDGALHITQSVPDERVAYDLDLTDGKYHFEGVLSLEPIGANTRVTWVCSWVALANPYTRYIDLVFVWMIGRYFERSLTHLRELVENAPAPQFVA